MATHSPFLKKRILQETASCIISRRQAFASASLIFLSFLPIACSSFANRNFLDVWIDRNPDGFLAFLL